MEYKKEEQDERKEKKKKGGGKRKERRKGTKDIKTCHDYVRLGSRHIDVIVNKQDNKIKDKRLGENGQRQKDPFSTSQSFLIFSFPCLSVLMFSPLSLLVLSLLLLFPRPLLFGLWPWEEERKKKGQDKRIKTT